MIVLLVNTETSWILIKITCCFFLCNFLFLVVFCAICNVLFYLNWYMLPKNKGVSNYLYRSLNTLPENEMIFSMFLTMSPPENFPWDMIRVGIQYKRVKYPYPKEVMGQCPG